MKIQRCIKGRCKEGELGENIFMISTIGIKIIKKHVDTAAFDCWVFHQKQRSNEREMETFTGMLSVCPYKECRTRMVN